MRAEQSSSKKMKLGWDSVQVSRFWSAPEETPQPVAGTNSKVTGDSFFFFLVSGHSFWLHIAVSTFNFFALSRLFYHVLSCLNQ